ncbi:MAG TPA: Crp/Fnr family transcriptional regulator [Nitrospiraceae bacterium]|nr:Crp/Fnr family transcriptional regulator [Nitrospiraceae bacterium]
MANLCKIAPVAGGQLRSMKSEVNQKTNRLLASLPDSEQDELLGRMETVSLQKRAVLWEQGARAAYVYFPDSATVSLTTLVEDGSSVEIATVGNEGALGLGVFLGAERALARAIVQSPGVARRIETAVFQQTLVQSPALNRIILRYTQALLFQITRAAGCNRFHSLEQRCARWLLTVADRGDTQELPLTQEFLSEMLGATRQAAGVAIEGMVKRGLIQTSRGTIRLLDRAGLEAASCECYRVVKEDLEQFLLWLPPTSRS